MISELFQESTWLLCVELVQVVLYLLLRADSMLVYNRSHKAFVKSDNGVFIP